MRARPGRARRDQGAAAVELALVLPVLFMLLFGIIDYGLWFNNSLTVRQGVRESARQAVVLRSPTGCVSPITKMADVACGTRSQILTSGAAYAKVFAPNGWVRGEKLVVCGMVKATSFTGFVPLPVGGLIKSKTTMSIEVTPTPLPNVTPFENTPPAGGNWSWCTA